MTHDQWTKSLAPKVNGSWNFHKILPQDLDFFVLLSSISAIIGNPGQSKYNSTERLFNFKLTNIQATTLPRMAIRTCSRITAGRLA